eukprot:4246045-Amphidinium_carterae.1
MAGISGPFWGLHTRTVWWLLSGERSGPPWRACTMHPCSRRRDLSMSGRCHSARSLALSSVRQRSLFTGGSLDPQVRLHWEPPQLRTVLYDDGVHKGGKEVIHAGSLAQLHYRH